MTIFTFPQKMRVFKLYCFLFTLTLILPQGTPQNHGYTSISQVSPVEGGGEVSVSSSVGVVGDPAQNQVIDNPVPTSMMFHYQMFPQPVAQRPRRGGNKKRCFLTEHGMKCPYRRDAQVHGDSYGNGGGHSSGHSGHDHSHQHPSQSYGAPGDSYGVPMEMMPAGYGSMNGGWGEEDDSSSGGGGSGLAGLLGLVGLKGLKGVKGLKGMISLLPFLPFLLPIIMPIIAIPSLFIGMKLVTLGFAFFAKAGFGRSAEDLVWNAGFDRVPKFLGNVLNSEECLERIACQVARTGRKYNASGWIERFENSLPQEDHYFDRMKKGFRFEKELKANSQDSAKSLGVDECKKFKCFSVFASKAENSI